MAACRPHPCRPSPCASCPPPCFHVPQENQELADKLAAAQVEASQRVALAQKAAASQVAAAKMEVSSKVDENERNLEDLRMQLRVSQVVRVCVGFLPFSSP